ncbi:hypothetical protein G9C98_006844 [Cotesia typhae]|uniref:Glucose-methanol-choline oxidoreductase C-terminal domain-containing protein n=1 Tax=Cotesia typhae TaxID=2053667 RepID=A0A8J5QKK4_9HYME|nr:hypothetical protein G9C98_006844 [Cotesia typhae]
MPYYIKLIFVADNRDKVTLLKSLDFIKSLLKTKTFKDLGVKLREAVIPGCDFQFDSPEYWECNLRHTAHSYFHSVGTTRMGPSNDPKSVVDSNLKVLGIDRLRVIDASIMPNVPAANTDAPTLMIAEKGADIIKNLWLNHY